MRKIYLIACLLVSVVCFGGNTAADSTALHVDATKYWPVVTDPARLDSATARTHPVFFKLFSQGTLYGDAVHQAVFMEETDDTDPVLITNSAINRSLIRGFVAAPWLFSTTQTAISEQQTVSDIPVAVVVPVPSEAVTPAEPAPVEVGDVDLNIVAEKPNFWKFDGSGALQFTQNYFSDNWYKGGTNNVALLALLKLHALYDNKENIQWETTLDAKLGFQTVDNDPYRKLRANNDQLRLTTKLGYKASKHWFYTVQAEGTTQFTKLYEPNTETLISDFGSPLKVVLSVGMDYKFEWKKFSGSAYISPVAMTWMYVHRLALVTRYGNDEGKRSRVTWGPNVTVNYTWSPWKNFSWQARVYFFTNFDYVNLEWENTFSFNFNKYISAKLFLYPRFDDSSINYRSEGGSYFMFKEWLSLGLDYSF